MTLAREVDSDLEDSKRILAPNKYKLIGMDFHRPSLCRKYPVIPRIHNLVPLAV
jgi:hypothetical protein